VPRKGALNQINGSSVNGCTRKYNAHDQASLKLRGLNRGDYFAGLFALGCASGLALPVIHSIREIGLVDALFQTFGISVIVLIACFAGIRLVMSERTSGLLISEIALGFGYIILVSLPIGPLNWIGVTALSLYLIFRTDASASRRGALILFAVTAPMLWSRMIFHFFASYILAADASVVSLLLGTQRNGNIVDFADNSGSLVILPACSSLANVSLAFLCWVTLSQLLNHKSHRLDILWCTLACAAVIAVNVSRMAFLGLSGWHYASFHNDWGDGVVNIITLTLVATICALGVRRELSHQI
jgi:hypothetical protein